MNLLSIDFGTSACKAAIWDIGGKILGFGRRAIAAYVDHGNITSNPESWWQLTVSAIHDAVEAADVSIDTIASICVCGFMHTPVGINSVGDIVVPTIPWNDLRGVRQAEQISEEASQLIYDTTGDGIRYNHTAAKIRWLRDEYPNESTEVNTWLLPKDYLRYKLTGKTATDVSDAMGTGMYDPNRNEWNKDLVELAGTKINAMPAIAQSTDIAGGLTYEAALETKLVPGTPVVIGCADGYATLLGADCCSDNKVCLYLGTSAWMTQFISASNVDARKRIVPTPHGFHRWIGSVASAGASIFWFIDRYKFSSFTEFFHSIEKSPSGSNGVFFLPHLAGERGPFYEPNARGAFVGLSLQHTRDDLSRAVLEGISFQIRYVLEAERSSTPIERAVVVGGGAVNQNWLQMLSDILQITLEVPRIYEAGILGVALISGSALGVLGDPHSEAMRFNPIVREYSPDTGNVATYDKLYSEYKKIDDAWLTVGRQI